MSMEPQDVYVIRGDELESLLHYLVDRKPYKVSVCLDEGGVKLKVDEYTWSPPLGRSLADEDGASSPSGARDSGGRPLSYQELIERLAEVRRTTPVGFVTQSELSDYLAKLRSAPK